MKCPYCLAHSMDSELTTSCTPDKTAIDLCPNCHGLWFDDGEMSDFLKWFESSGEGFGIKELLVAKPKTTSEPVGKMCPHCSVPLKVFNYAYNSNIFLDKCPECQGVWVDNGEINNIAKYQKGHPLLDAYAGDLVEHAEIVGAGREATKQGSLLTRHVGYGPFNFPVFNLPLSDSEDITIPPAATLVILLLNIAVFAVSSYYVRDYRSFYQTYGLGPNINPMTLITSMFLHANWEHLVGNMLFFYVFADKLENAMGHWRFLAFYLLVGVAAGFIDVAFWGQTDIPRIGASGAISGVMGGYYLMFPKSYIKMLIFDRVVRVYAQYYLAIWIGQQLLMATLAAANPFFVGVAWLAHIGGFFSGMAAIYALREYKLLPKDNGQEKSMK